jgi:hypothetical protein
VSEDEELMLRRALECVMNVDPAFEMSAALSEA